MRMLIVPSLAMLALVGCNDRENVRMASLQAENQDLRAKNATHEAEVRTLNDRITLLEEENKYLRRETSGAPAASPDVTAPAAAAPVAAPATVAASTPQPGGPASLPSINNLPDEAAMKGSWVVVLASLGPASAAGETDTFKQRARSQNNRASGTVKPIFGVRTPRSGGLQLIYGDIGGTPGIRKDLAQAALADLKGTFKDAFLLNVD